MANKMSLTPCSCEAWPPGKISPVSISNPFLPKPPPLTLTFLPPPCARDFSFFSCKSEVISFLPQSPAQPGCPFSLRTQPRCTGTSGQPCGHSTDQAPAQQLRARGYNSQQLLSDSSWKCLGQENGCSRLFCRQQQERNIHRAQLAACAGSTASRVNPRVLCSQGRLLSTTAAVQRDIHGA